MSSGFKHMFLLKIPPKQGIIAESEAKKQTLDSGRHERW
jgi:hypothetical protein